MVGKTNSGSSGSGGSSGDNTVILSPGAWNDEYKPTITLEGTMSKGDPSAQQTLGFRCSGSGQIGYANFAWGSDVRGKKARIFYRCMMLLDGYFVYHYDGNTIDIWRGPGALAPTYYSSYFDVDDLSKLESIEIKVSDNAQSYNTMEIYAIELI